MFLSSNQFNLISSGYSIDLNIEMFLVKSKDQTKRKKHLHQSR